MSESRAELFGRAADALDSVRRHPANGLQMPVQIGDFVSCGDSDRHTSGTVVDVAGPGRLLLVDPRMTRTGGRQVVDAGVAEVDETWLDPAATIPAAQRGAYLAKVGHLLIRAAGDRNRWDGTAALYDRWAHTLLDLGET